MRLRGSGAHAPVDDADGVQVLEREHDLRGVEARAALVERAQARHVAEHVAAARQRQHEMCTRDSQPQPQSSSRGHTRAPAGGAEPETSTRTAPEPVAEAEGEKKREERALE